MKAPCWNTQSHWSCQSTGVCRLSLASSGRLMGLIPAGYLWQLMAVTSSVAQASSTSWSWDRTTSCPAAPKLRRASSAFPITMFSFTSPSPFSSRMSCSNTSRVSVNWTSGDYDKAERVPFLWRAASPAQPPVSALTAPSSPSCCRPYPGAPGSPPARPKLPGGCPQRPGSPGSPEACLWPSSAEPDTPSGAGPSPWPRLLTPGQIQREPGPPDRDAQQTPCNMKTEIMNCYSSTFTIYTFKPPIYTNLRAIRSLLSLSIFSSSSEGSEALFWLSASRTDSLLKLRSICFIQSLIHSTKSSKLRERQGEEREKKHISGK